MSSGWSRTSAALLTAALVPAACHPRPAAPDVAAVITDATPQSRAELARVVSHALEGATVTLADDALTGDSTLIIQRASRRDAQGLPLNGRETGRPERFQLVKNGPRCVLLQERTGRRFELAATTCSPR
jgi:hypothetical protein